MSDLCLDEEVAEVTWASLCNERFFRKYLFASIRRLKNRKVFSTDLVEVRRGWIAGNYIGDTSVVFHFGNAWLQGVVLWNLILLFF